MGRQNWASGPGRGMWDVGRGTWAVGLGEGSKATNRIANGNKVQRLISDLVQRGGPSACLCLDLQAAVCAPCR